MEIRDLAQRVGTSRHTIARFEAGTNEPHHRTRAAIRAELERYGIRFIFRPDCRPLGIIEESEP
jgi:transcriptional regulator with XRE-family HTH domain